MLLANYHYAYIMEKHIFNSYLLISNALHKFKVTTQSPNKGPDKPNFMCYEKFSTFMVSINQERQKARTSKYLTGTNNIRFIHSFTCVQNPVLLNCFI